MSYITKLQIIYIVS